MMDKSSNDFSHSYAPNYDLRQEDVLKFRNRNPAVMNNELVNLNGEMLEILCFGEALSKPPCNGVSVVCRSFTRSNPTIKDSKFV